LQRGVARDDKDDDMIGWAFCRVAARKRAKRDELFQNKGAFNYIAY
jgi:hypothetical protein